MLQDTSLSLVAHQDIKSRLAEKRASYRRRLSIQFDQLFPKGKVAMQSIRSCANDHRQ